MKTINKKTKKPPDKIKQYENTILTTATNTGIPRTLAQLIIAQAKHETNNFTSKVFTENTNAFGYKHIEGGRFQMQAGRRSPEGNQYAHYSTLENSTRELIAWIHRRLVERKFPQLDTITTPTQYAALLKKCGYYTDRTSTYATGLKKWFNNK